MILRSRAINIRKTFNEMNYISKEEERMHWPKQWQQTSTQILLLMHHAMVTMNRFSSSDSINKMSYKKKKNEMTLP